MQPITFNNASVVVPKAMEDVFFKKFNPPVEDPEIKKQMVKYMLESVSRMIAKSLERYKQRLKEMREQEGR